MDYVSMKMSIYENYANGKLSRGNARQLIDVLNSNYGNILVQEMVDAENEFMMNSVNAAYESAGVDALYEASETFGQKVVKIWENFKKWIKGIIDAILGRKKEVPDTSKVTVKKGLPKAMDDLVTQVKKLKSAKGAVAIGAAVAGVIGATAAVKKLKGKPSKGDATEETDATALAKKAEDVAKNAADPPKVETPAAAQGQSSEQKTADPKSGEEQVTPSKIISSVTGAATVADDVSKQATASSPEHTESSTDFKQLFDKFDKNGGLNDLYGDAKELTGICYSALKKYADYDSENEIYGNKSRKTAQNLIDGYVSNCGGVPHENRIGDYCKEYRAILDKEYPDTPEGDEKLRSALVGRNGKIMSIMKDLEAGYNKVDSQVSERNLENYKRLHIEDWSAQAATAAAGVYVNCRDLLFHVRGLWYALHDRCHKMDPSSMPTRMYI